MTNADEVAPAGLLGTKYSQALRLWRGGVRLYRASEDGGDWYERRPRPRTSTDTGNEYTLLISEFLPSWQRVHASYFGVSAVVARLSEEEQVRHRGGAARLR